MRKFVIGDIRGDLYLLKKLIDKIAPLKEDVLIFLGSYLGPGEDSKGVIDYLLDLREKPGTFIFLKGCYEYMFGHCISENPSLERVGLWAKMQGDKVFQSYAAKEKLVVMSPPNGKPSKAMTLEIPLKIPESHVRFFERDLYCMFSDSTLPFIACHNGFYAGVHGQEGLAEDYAYFTPEGWAEDDRFQIPNKEIIFSHTPTGRVQIRKGKINLDLGAGLGGNLACMEMFNREITVVRRTRLA